MHFPLNHVQVAFTVILAFLGVCTVLGEPGDSPAVDLQMFPAELLF